MDTHDPLWTLEHRFWREGLATYQQHLAADARLVFPLPTGVLDHAATLDAVRDAPRWREVRFDDRHVIAMGADAVLLVYAVEAWHDADPESYEALCTSAYRLDGDEWRLVLHQQTPGD